jgi:hypothetical protein
MPLTINTIVFWLLSFVAPAPPEPGIYSWSEGPAPRIKRNDGAEIVLGKLLGKTFGQATMHSVKNDNSQFVLQLKNAGPLAAEATSSYMALMIDGICLGVWSHSDPHANGTMDLSCSVYGEEAAKRVAAALKIDLPRRKHPGHRFETRFVPEKESYGAGEPVTLKMEIRNTGAAPFTFMVGGKQRGPRDNQFRFLAYRSYGMGKAVADTGDPLNFGGIGSYHTLKPGETLTKSITLDKWFTFTEADYYRITGIYELELYDFAPPDRFGSPIWDDLAVGDCLVRVVAKDK